jgi:hypothetical protein
LPKLKILVGLWGATEDVTEATKRLGDSGADEVVTTLANALVEMAKLAPPLIEEMTPAPIPADEEERLACPVGTQPPGHRRGAGLRPDHRKTCSRLRGAHRPHFVDRSRPPVFQVADRPPRRSSPRHARRRATSPSAGTVVAKNQVMVIDDLARDRRFANNPLLKEHGIRFYAGVPLLAPNGQPIGSLCLMDLKPRQLTEREKRVLLEYADEVMEEIAKRAPQPRSVELPVAAPA